MRLCCFGWLYRVRDALPYVPGDLLMWGGLGSRNGLKGWRAAAGSAEAGLKRGRTFRQIYVKASTPQASRTVQLVLRAEGRVALQTLGRRYRRKTH
jgi:hypothetical protein